MKNQIFVFLALIMLGLASCTDDLNQKPVTDSTADADQVFSSVAGYKSALAKLYASYVIAGQEQGGGNADLTSNNGHDFLRGYFNLQEAATDEMAGTWLSGDKITNLTYMNWDATDPWVADTYYRAYYTIALCNEFLTHATAEVANGDSEIKAFRAEARFLRALAYYYVLDLFGQGPFVDESMGIGSYTPERYSAAQLFEFVKAELDDIVADGLLDYTQCEYGRASRQAAQALLAKLCLNAEVYKAGNHYNDCLAYCHAIMKSGYSLEQDYAKLFNADNDKRTNEIIFSFVVDAVNTVSWGATTYIVCGECGNSSSQDPTKYGLTNGWGMFRVRGELPALFDNDGSDSRYMFYTDGQEQWFTKAIDDQSQGFFGEKFSNLNDAGEAASNTQAVGADIDFPVFRLADVYLMAAEAILRGATLTTDGVTYNTDKAVELVNKVRARAYGDEDHGTNVAQLNLQYILDERGRELYWECTRRTDLVRFGQFTGGAYKWQWKGGVLDGRSTDSKYNIYPIPTAELSANPNLSNENY